MLRIIVDSGSSIKQNEKEKYNVEIAPLRFLMGETEYIDGVDLEIDEFYKMLIGKKLFPKTSLPNLEDLREKVDEYSKNGDDVLIITISSGISGTYSTITQMFEEYKNVEVVDSLSAVGGVKILVMEANKFKDEPLAVLAERLRKLATRLCVFAIPETLNYLLKGGRLSKKEWLLGSMLNIKPVISLNGGSVKVVDKKIGLKKAMLYLVDTLKKYNCDENYPIFPSYTYDKGNLEKLIEMTPKEYHSQMAEFDNLDPAIACHWGPNAFGYIFVAKE